MNERSINRLMEILLVEDSLVDARFTMVALKHGAIRYRLTLVCDGEEAIAFLRREGVFARAPRPDLVLLDLILRRSPACAPAGSCHWSWEPGFITHTALAVSRRNLFPECMLRCICRSGSRRVIPQTHYGSHMGFEMGK